MSETNPISIMIHNLNPWGGQDRSMLEIAWQLNRTIPLEIHSFSIEGDKEWFDMKHIPYQAKIQRPIIFKYLSYQKQTKKNINPNSIVQSTGTASLVSDVVQVQFLHHEWQEIYKLLPEDKRSSGNFLKAAYHQWLTQYKLKMEAKAYTKNKHYIAISHGIKKQLIKHFSIPANNISIIHHGVDTEAFCPFQDSEDGSTVRKQLREQHNIKPDDVLLLHVGALNARKGLFKTFELLSYLKKQGFDNIKFLAVGQGDQHILKKNIKDLDIEDRVQLVSHTKQVRDYYWASDLFMFPTFYEPFGLVILEALSCGIPALTTTVAGASELMTSADMGVLFNPEASVPEIANLIVPAFRDANLRKQWGENAREMSLQQTWKKVGNKYRRFYRDFMKQLDAKDF